MGGSGNGGRRMATRTLEEVTIKEVIRRGLIPAEKPRVIVRWYLTAQKLHRNLQSSLLREEEMSLPGIPKDAVAYVAGQSETKGTGSDRYHYCIPIQFYKRRE